MKFCQSKYIIYYKSEKYKSTLYSLLDNVNDRDRIKTENSPVWYIPKHETKS